MAEGWQTYVQIASQFVDEESGPFEAHFAQARQAGWLRSDFPAVIQLTLVFQACQSYLAFVPLYQRQFPAQDLASAAALARARQSLAAWVVGAMMVDVPETIETEPTAGGIA